MMTSLKISENDQRDFRSGVGMLLYLVKHSRPDLSNAVRELTKVMDGATEEHVKLLHRVIKFVLDTRDRGIIIKPKTMVLLPSSIATLLEIKGTESPSPVT
jgi:hypothetical protein